MDLGEVRKWIHISCHLGFDARFWRMTSGFIRRASHEDFCQSTWLLDHGKLSQAVQGKGLVLGRRRTSYAAKKVTVYIHLVQLVKRDPQNQGLRQRYMSMQTKSS